ncbi:MAG: cytochrome ubiquinol oxidase subunit I [Calditrichaeota bacterium]|nr:cytochrome ubiquinol oxidase subunit I [Calditrichota bacterium]
MGAVTLARWQFATTTVYHFFFVPLTLGLSVFVAILETLYVVTGKEVYKRMTLFWGKLFLINFILGVVTGLVQEFQFGMNWSEYSRFVGDIFGAPLAIEALLAFFLESTFLGVWIFGWDRLSKKAHAATIWLVAIGSNLSALWILIANSFMQQPRGYELVYDSAGNVIRAQMTSFADLVFNPNVWVQFPHVLASGIVTAAFFVIGISGYHLFKKSKDPQAYRLSLKYSAIYGFIGILLVILIGHSQMQHIVRIQPMKVASAEAIWNTENPASLSLFTIGNEKERKDIFAIKIPYLVSVLAYNSLEGEIKGINQLQEEYEQKYGPGDYVPPVAVSYWSFRIMVGAGVLMLILSVYLLTYVIKDKFEFKPWVYKALLFAIALPYLANSAGWILTEVGRQPWLVYGLLKTTDGVSPYAAVSAGEVMFSLITFGVLYGILMVVDVYLLKKYALAGTSEIDKENDL